MKRFTGAIVLLFAGLIACIGLFYQLPQLFAAEGTQGMLEGAMVLVVTFLIVLVCGKVGYGFWKGKPAEAPPIPQPEVKKDSPE